LHQSQCNEEILPDESVPIVQPCFGLSCYRVCVVNTTCPFQVMARGPQIAGYNDIVRIVMECLTIDVNTASNCYDDLVLIGSAALYIPYGSVLYVAVNNLRPRHFLTLYISAVCLEIYLSVSSSQSTHIFADNDRRV
jgi:hypothetical protein